MTNEVYIEFRPRRKDPNKWQAEEKLRPLLRKHRGHLTGGGTELHTGTVDMEYEFRLYKGADGFAKAAKRSLRGLRDLRISLTRRYVV